MSYYIVSCGTSANTTDESFVTESWVAAVLWMAEHLTNDNLCRVELSTPEETELYDEDIHDLTSAEEYAERIGLDTNL